MAAPLQRAVYVLAGAAPRLGSQATHSTTPYREGCRSIAPSFTPSLEVSSHAAYTPLRFDCVGRFGTGGGFTLDVAAFRSIFDIDHIDYTLVSADVTGRASATTFRTPERANRADSAEVRVGRQFESGNLSHLATVSLRGGRTIVDLTSSLAIPLGTFAMHRGDVPDGMVLPWSGTRGEDTVERVTASAGYGLAWSDRIQLRFAIHRTRYQKDVLSIAGVQSGGVSETSLYNASFIVSLTDRMAAFGSWVTGLEEAGVAPTSSINRDEVLPPVEAEQLELGVRHAITPGLTFIGALFDVSKPTNGLRADRSFGLVGEVRHRGVEASIAGKLGAKTTVVLGAVAFEPEVTGPLVASKGTSRRGPASSRRSRRVR